MVEILVAHCGTNVHMFVWKQEVLGSYEYDPLTIRFLAGVKRERRKVVNS